MKKYGQIMSLMFLENFQIWDTIPDSDLGNCLEAVRNV